MGKHGATRGIFMQPLSAVVDSSLYKTGRVVTPLVQLGREVVPFYPAPYGGARSLIDACVVLTIARTILTVLCVAM